ncbi:hypothetical protein [uncultured Phycicoccus sp.]|uniref:hypothetical protein n=1 Tax=uncultured Phycicoccus sp. TaxID=661422 RepID=UPI002613AF48|nr:hypothetical protein [uncultured Phycicoccus sp.]
MTRPTHRPLHVVLVVAAAVVLGLGAVGTLAFCSVFGCTVFSERFEPTGDEATKGRARAAEVALRAADAVTAGREVLASATVDGCDAGQHGWKRKDTYSHECFVVVSRTMVVVASGGSDAVGEGLTATDALVRAQGCAPSYGRDLDEVRAEYWRPDHANVQRFGAAGLPGARYECAPDPELEPGSVVVEVQPTSTRAPGDAAGAFGHFRLDQTFAGSWYDDDQAAAVTGSGVELAVVVTVRVGYYDTTF